MMTSSNGNIFRVTGPLWGESRATGELPSQRPVTRGFDVFFEQRLSKRLSKQSRSRWFETPSRSLLRLCNGHDHLKCSQWLQTWSREHSGYGLSQWEEALWSIGQAHSQNDPLWSSQHDRLCVSEGVRQCPMYNAEACITNQFRPGQDGRHSKYAHERNFIGSHFLNQYWRSSLSHEYASQVLIGLTHCGLVTPYGDINLGQHWLR